MHKISTYLDQDHRRCDEQYAVAESDVNLPEERLLHRQADLLLAHQAEATIAAMEKLYHLEAA